MLETDALKEKLEMEIYIAQGLNLGYIKEKNKVIAIYDKQTVYIGSLLNGCRYCITNNLARLRFVLEEYNQTKYKNCFIVFTL